jgi:hypothetical protein
VNARIRFIRELSWNPRFATKLPGNFFSLRHGTAHTLRPFREDDFGTKRAQHVASLDRHGFRHCQDAAITVNSSRESKTDSGVAAGWLDDGHAWLEHAALNGIFNHRHTDAVLH